MVRSDAWLRSTPNLEWAPRTPDNFVFEKSPSYFYRLSLTSKYALKRDMTRNEFEDAWKKQVWRSDHNKVILCENGKWTNKCCYFGSAGKL